VASESAVELVRRSHAEIERILRHAAMKRREEMRDSMRSVLAHVGAELIALNTFLTQYAPGLKTTLPLLSLPASSIRVAESLPDEATAARWLVEIQDALEVHHREIESFLHSVEAQVTDEGRAELVNLLERWLEPTISHRR
jgi:hypothetical protein